ncbi:hypothetical protein PFISCL1PPCAC_2934, partial [Pristionchus fissidentatus]
CRRARRAHRRRLRPVRPAAVRTAHHPVQAIHDRRQPVPEPAVPAAAAIQPAAATAAVQPAEPVRTDHPEPVRLRQHPDQQHEPTVRPERSTHLLQLCVSRLSHRCRPNFRCCHAPFVNKILQKYQKNPFEFHLHPY